MLNCDTLPTKSNKRYRLKFLGIAVMLAFVFLALGLGMLGERVLAAPLLRITLGFESDPADENAADEYAATVSPGDTITYFLRFKETSDPSTGTLWQILPPGMEILSTDPGVDSQSGDLQSGYVITWSNINIPDDAEYVYTVTASAPVSASMRTELLSEMFFETNQNTMKSDDVSHWLQPYIGKPLWTSVTEGVNGRNEVVAGELLTTTIYYTVPAETYVYSLTPRIQFEEGLVPDDVGATGEITTTFDDWEIGSSAYEVRYPQQTFSPVEDGGVLSYTISGHVIQSDLNNGNTVVIAPLLRWCDAADCDFSLFEENDDYVWWDDRDNVTFLRPEVDPTIVGPTYLDALTQGEGGGQVQFFLENANLSDSAIAYDLVLTATLGPGLEFASSMPAAPDGQWTTTVGGPTYLTWTVPISVVEGAAWPVTITANLPDTLVYGQYFTVTSAMYQETFAGDQPYEGKYVEVDDSFDFYAELDVANASKTASRANMRIGEFVSYTTVFTVSPNATLANFRSEDLLGAGLHYVTQTLTVDGATLDDVQVQPDGASERLVWSLGTINTGNDALVVTVVYQAWLDAVGLDGVPTFVGGRISDFFTDDVLS